MKARIPIPYITIVWLAVGALCVPPALAKERQSPSPVASASPAASAAATVKPARPIPYHGKVASVDARAKTFIVGKRMMKVTRETKITSQDATATMADIVAGERVRGSYWKKADGTLEAKSVKLGAKESPKQDKAGAEASPSVSPKP